MNTGRRADDGRVRTRCSAAGDQDQQNTVILLSQRWNSLKREERMGVINRSDATVANNRITMSILEVLNDLH